MPLALHIGSTQAAGARRQALLLAKRLRAEGHACAVTAVQPAHAATGVAQVLHALVASEIDVAPVACKALPHTLPEALMVVATLPREDITPILVQASKLPPVQDAALLLATHPLLAAEWRAAHPGHCITLVQAHTAHEALHAGSADGLLAYRNELDAQEQGVALPQFHHPAAHGVWALLARKDDTLLRDWLMRWHNAETRWAVAAEQALVAQQAHMPIQGVRLSITQSAASYIVEAHGVGYSAGGVCIAFRASAIVQQLDKAAIVSITNAVIMDTA